MKTTSCLYPLNSDLHDFDQELFGCTRDLNALTPTKEGWTALMVACSECGFTPEQNSLFKAGELFIVQNFGNVVVTLVQQPLETEVSQIVKTLGLRDVIVCGHLNCKTVNCFVNGAPAIQWVRHGNRLRHLIKNHYSHLNRGHLEQVAVQENVLIQLEKVASEFDQHDTDLRVHGWIHDSQSARVFSYNPDCGQFE